MSPPPGGSVTGVLIALTSGCSVRGDRGDALVTAKGDATLPGKLDRVDQERPPLYGDGWRARGGRVLGDGI